nr:hypothetical protein [Aeromicrobium ginsengisoli]
MEKDPLTSGNAGQGVFLIQVRKVLGQHSGNSRLSALGSACQIHRVGDLVEAVLEEMSVRVEGHRRRAVAEHLLHDLDVSTGRDRQRRGSVAQLVRVQIRNADGRRCHSEGFAEHADPQCLATANSSEDEVFRCLAGDVPGEVVDEEPGDRHLATTMGLRCAPDETVALDGGH